MIYTHKEFTQTLLFINYFNLTELEDIKVFHDQNPWLVKLFYNLFNGIV